MMSSKSVLQGVWGFTKGSFCISFKVARGALWFTSVLRDNVNQKAISPVTSTKYWSATPYIEGKKEKTK